jgi:hypothetical protein
LVSNFSEIDFRLEIRRLVSLLAPYTAWQVSFCDK